MLASVIRSLVFDLDGTLVHSLPGIAASLNRSLENAGLPTHPESAVRSFIGDGIAKLVERATPKTQLEVLNKLVQTVKSDYATTWHKGTQPYPGVVETLGTLADANIPCSVFSNKPDEYCREITDRIFPDIPFSIVRGQLPDAPGKPDPAGAISICNQSGIPAGETALIGDSTIDLETARNAGMISIAVSWGYHDPPALAALKPRHTIHTMEQLLPILNV